MKKYLILLLFSTFAIGQTTIVNKLKINSAVKNNTDTRVLVQDSITKEVHWVLKASLGSVPSWNSTLSVNSTAQQNVTVNDPYNLYLRSGHLKLWHNIDADYADISIGSGYWKFNNSQFQDFEITPQGFSTYKYGGFTGSFNNSSLTANHSYGIPNVDGTLLTTAGTEVGIPITGDLQFDPYKKLYSEDAINTGEVFLAPDNILLTSSSKASSSEATIQVNSDGSIMIGSYDADENPLRGITGQENFTPNLTANDYIQKNGVVLRGGTEAGSPITGEIEVTEVGKNFWIKGADYDELTNNVKHSISFSEASVVFESVNSTTGVTSSFQASDGGISISDNSVLSRGIKATGNYSANITDLDFTQKIYVDGLRGKFISKTTTEINAIATPQNGETYFNTTISTLCFFDGTDWKRVSHSAM